MHTNYSHGEIADCFVHPVPDGGRRIAWDTVSFCVPSNWELGLYKFQRRGVSRIELEDEYSIRLEAEWTRSRKRLDSDRIMERYTEASRPLTIKAEKQQVIQGMPAGWHATRFVFQSSDADDAQSLGITPHELVTCFYLCPRTSIFCFFILHFFPEEQQDAATVTRQLAMTFQDHGREKLVPWQLYDIAVKVPREFVLTKTHFDIGMKLMVFSWRQRRYFLWHFACADVFLKSGLSPAESACGYLNSSTLLKAPVFYPDGRGGIAWRRRRPYIFGHREEIARWCYRYDVGCRLNKERNQLVAWVYHHRHRDDLR